MLPLIQNPFVVIALQLSLGCVCILLGFSIYRFLARSYRAQRSDLLTQVNACLPQTQCGRCGFAGCLPYAEAITRGTAINQCPPGGERSIVRLASLLNRPVNVLNPAHGTTGPRLIARIREEECIGCTKCIQVCPTSAILGARKLMHSVIISDCTGCDLCLEPCPVDCIDMVIATTENSAEVHYRQFNPSSISL